MNVELNAASRLMVSCNIFTGFYVRGSYTCIEARNVLDNVKATVSDMADRVARSPEVRKWITSVFRNWLQNEGPATDVVELAPDAPEWAQKALQERQLVTIDWRAAEDTLLPIVDYLNHRLGEGQKIDALSVVDAMRLQKEWHDSLAMQMEEDNELPEGKIVPVHSFSSGYHWVQVCDAQALNREGDIMGHCVGDYADQVMRDNLRIYSLRDPKNGPHITIEVRRGSNSVEQIKGKANEEVVARYRPYILPFLGALSFDRIDLDLSGITRDEAVSYFRTNKLMRVISADAPENPKEASFGTFEVTEATDYDDARNAHELPLFFDDNTPRYTLRGVNIRATRHDGTRTTMSIPYYQLRGGAPTKYNTIADALGVTLTASDCVSIAAAICAVHKWADLDSLLVSDYLAAGALVKTYERQGASAALVLKPTDERVSLILRTQQPDYFVALGSQLLFTVTNNRLCCLEGASAKVSKYPQDVIADLADFFQPLDIRALPKGLQSKLVVVNADGLEVQSKKHIHWKNAPPPLLQALKVFRTTLKEPVMVSLDNGPPKTALKHVGATSGYLYAYFSAFLHLAMSKNKETSCAYLVTSMAMLRQFVAFTSQFSSIKTGSWYRDKTTAERTKALQAWKIIQKYMPNLFPLNAEQVAKLMAMRSPPAFKKALEQHWLA